MRNKTTIKGKIVIEYLEKFPEVKSNTLAIKIFNENIKIFDSIENTRALIRYYRGTIGKRSRSELASRRFVREDTIQSTDNEFGLPESDALEYPVFTIPAAQNQILVLSDVHVPYHSVDALTVALRWGKEHNINTVFINGDFWDFHQLSSFVRDPRKRRFDEEREIGWRVLDTIREVFPDAVIYFKVGNHEERWEKYLKIKAPEIFNTSDFQLDTILRLGERGISYIGDKIRVKAGKLYVIHGHEYKGGGGVNPARWLSLRTNGSAMCSHFHTSSEHTVNNIDGDIIGCWSVGCLCELNPDYSPLNPRGNHGFARIQVNGGGNFKVTNLKIFNGKLL